jgi:hypothetical protein
MVLSPALRLLCNPVLQGPGFRVTRLGHMRMFTTCVAFLSGTQGIIRRSIARLVILPREKSFKAVTSPTCHAMCSMCMTTSRLRSKSCPGHSADFPDIQWLCRVVERVTERKQLDLVSIVYDSTKPFTIEEQECIMELLQPEVRAISISFPSHWTAMTSPVRSR